MAHGAWRMAHGAWHMAHGAWRMAHGTWHTAHGAWRMAHGGVTFSSSWSLPCVAGSASCCAVGNAAPAADRAGQARALGLPEGAQQEVQDQPVVVHVHQHPHVAAGKGWGEAVASNRMPAPALGRRAVGGGPSGWRAYHHHKSSICREVWDVRAYREGEVAEGGGVRETWGGGTLQGVLGGHRELWGASGDSRPGLAVGSWPGLAAGDVAEG